MPRRARKDLDIIQERCAKVVELRARGLTWDAIASEVGYANASSASKAWHKAIAQRPDQAVDKIRAEAATRLEYLYAQSVQQITQPGPRVSAIGKIAVYPDGHPRAGQIVEDEAIRARALDNARKAIGDYVRLTGAELVPTASGLTEQQIRTMAEVLIRQRDLDAQAPRVPIQLPATYSQMTRASKPPPTSPPAASRSTPSGPP